MQQSPTDAAGRGERRRERIVVLGLVLGTALLYAPALGFDFVNYDDPVFVTENPLVLPGLTWDGFILALTSNYADYWRPLSWLSHMLDVELFGLHSGFHHLTSVLWHAAATAVLFLALKRMTGALWCSAFVAALFAWHPLHVESVAWVGERKDVMCAFFWFLTMLAYWRYTTQPTRWNYSATLASFVLGLMSKPMIVTLPFVLLLLDVWPLRRFQPALLDTSVERGRSAGKNTAGNFLVAGWPLVLEKMPFLILAGLTSVAAFVGARDAGSMHTLESLSIPARLANSAVACATYLGMTFWPVNLAVLYPLPAAWPAWRMALSLVLIVGTTFLALRARRARPYALVGWLWFLGSLAPVSGLMQAGAQAVADRYTYVPAIGLFIIAAWVAAAWAGTHAGRRKWLLVAAATVLIACVIGTGRQLSHWKNSITLFEHALAATRDNWTAHNNLGLAYLAEGRTEDATLQFNESLRVVPVQADAHLNLGVIHDRTGRYAEARKEFALALAQESDSGKIALTLSKFAEKARSEPTNCEARYYLAYAFASAGRNAEAISALELVLQIKPDYSDAHDDLATVLVKAGRPNEAIAHYRMALRLRPDEAGTLTRLAWLLATAADAQVRNGPEALKLATRACELTARSDARALNALAAAMAETGNFEEAATVEHTAAVLARAAGNGAAAAQIEARAALYRSGRPYHQPPR